MPQRTSRYLTMRDGVQIAVDLWLPDQPGAGARLPAILHQTRYFRRVAWRGLLHELGIAERLDDHIAVRHALLAAGYAWVNVDVRGSGASSGTWASPWWRDEVADGNEVVEWVIRQPWSSGKVGATGVSYSGTTAEFLLTRQHPAVKACVPRFSLFDVYTDVAFPGGLHLFWFTEAWNRFNHLLDQNQYHTAFALVARHNLEGLAEWLEARGRATANAALSAMLRYPVERGLDRLVRTASRGVAVPEGEEGRFRQHLSEHAENVDLHRGALGVTHRDSRGMLSRFPDATIDDFSPHRHITAVRAGGAAVLSYSGWFDGAYQHAAIKRHLNLSTDRSRLLLGPWDHGGTQDVSPFNERVKCEYDHAAEVLRFFDYHLRGIENGAMDGPPVRYFTLGSERWQSSELWPPPARRTSWHLAATHRLRAPGAAATDSDEPGVHRYRIDPEAGSGKRSRWRSLIPLTVPVGYPDRRRADERLLCYTSEPLPEAIEVTGHPLVRLSISCDGADVALFAYLEDVDPAGRVTYVTEGQLRGLHRRLSTRRPPYALAVPYHSFESADAAPIEPGEVEEFVFDLLPTSYVFGRHHCLRLALAGADRDAFAIPVGAASEFRVHHGGSYASHLELPIATSS